MSDTEFTEKQIADFRRYVKIQHGGRYNMFDPKARMLTGLDKDEYVFIMENYEALRKAALRPVQMELDFGKGE